MGLTDEEKKKMNSEGWEMITVDMDSGTWMNARTCVTIPLAKSEFDLFTDMSDSERVQFVRNHQNRWIIHGNM